MYVSDVTLYFLFQCKIAFTDIQTQDQTVSVSYGVSNIYKNIFIMPV